MPDGYLTHDMVKDWHIYLKPNVTKNIPCHYLYERFGQIKMNHEQRPTLEADMVRWVWKWEARNQG
jgi:hypothetical protein